MPMFIEEAVLANLADIKHCDFICFIYYGIASYEMILN